MIIAIWGGVGTGKSTVLDILKTSYDAEVLQADIIAHELYNPGMEGNRIIDRLTHGQVIDDQGRVDRAKLSDMIYSDAYLRSKIDMEIHPCVIREIEKRVRVSRKRLIAIESAIPYQEADDLCDEIWYVYSSESDRISRLMTNRGYSEARSREIIDAQLSDAEYRAKSTVVIDNSGDLEMLKKQIDKELDGKLN